MEGIGFSVSFYDDSFYHLNRGNDTILVWIHVDDGIVTASLDFEPRGTARCTQLWASRWSVHLLRKLSGRGRCQSKWIFVHCRVFKLLGRCHASGPLLCCWFSLPLCQVANYASLVSSSAHVRLHQSPGVSLSGY
ncbi:uncharacterized protein VP01_4485g2 [Puccinia sorghi]|uniref:Uncharacterized protein n=1 Tax=Puccinia sorghi TaxID=27349 RepID=A0A0L6URA0_9BASI|nr:uncharacterized protein VP01_4485g2 [Puccinia sorghi]